MEIQVNYFAVLLAAIVSMVVGFLWYSPFLLGKPWMKEMGYTPDSIKKAQKEMGKLYALSFIVALITAYVLSHVMTLSMNFFQTSELSTALNTAFWMWLGFVMPVQVTNTIFSDKNWKLFGINTGHQLTSLVVMAITIALV